MTAAAATADTRELSRLTRGVEIVRILLKHDFFRMMRSISVAASRNGVPGREPVIPPGLPRRVRLMLEELGPTFIKVGQLLGTRPDLVPKAFVSEFRALYDKTTPSPFPAVKALVEDELGIPLETAFAEFEETPIASASIGQVHRARLKTGERVAVKVQHPAIEERVHLDFMILRPIVTFVENLFAASRVWQPSDHFEELREMLRRELDYAHEAKQHQRVYDNFTDVKDVMIPRIHASFSSKRVLTLEYIDGVKLSADDLPLEGIDGPAVARTITHAMAKQIFQDRVFHADPSPGNLLVVGERTVAFLDFGAVGIVTRRRSERILHLITGFVRNDLDAVVQSLVDLCNVRGELDLKSLSRDVEKILDYHERERASVADPVVLDMILDVAAKHNMLLPPDFMLITRALFQFEGLCKRLDPSYELVDVLSGDVKEHLRDQVFSAARQKEAVVDMALQYGELMRHLPARLNAILGKIEQGEFAVQVDVRGATEDRRAREKRVFVGGFTAVIAALVLGVALVFASGGGQALENFGFFAFLFVALWATVVLYFWE